MTEVGGVKFVSGFCWHGHHGVLVEWCFDYKERAEYIRTEKPKCEQELRLRLFQPVKGVLPKEFIEAGRVWCEARRACGEAWQVCDEVQRVFDEAVRVFDEAVRACDEAGRVFDEIPNKHKNTIETIEALHAKECLNCPWDGHTIFPVSL